MRTRKKDVRPFSGFKSREAQLSYHKAWRDKNKAHCVAYRKQYRGLRGPAHRIDRYGLRPDDFNAMVAAQAGKCAICREEPHGAGAMGVLHVDHCHVTGHVRALLCHRCNKGLGGFKDDAMLLVMAAMYLRKHARARHTA